MFICMNRIIVKEVHTMIKDKHMFLKWGIYEMNVTFVDYIAIVFKRFYFKRQKKREKKLSKMNSKQQQQQQNENH